MTDQPKEKIALKRPTDIDKRIPIPNALAFAAEKIDKGELQAAEGIIRQVQEKQPENPHANHLLGIIAHRVGRTELALELIGKAIETLPGVSQFHANRGEMCRLLKRHDEAVKHGEKAIDLDPENASAHSNLGIAYYDIKDYERAEKCQNKAIKLNSGLVQAYNNLGSIKRAQQDRDAAISFYKKALEVNPDYLESINNLGALLLEDDQSDDALKMLLRAVKLNPNYAEAHNNIGNAFLYKEDYEKASIAYQKALSLKPGYAEALVGVARIHKEKDDLDDALLTTKKALEIEPERPDIHSLLGEIYLKQGNYLESEAAYNKAIELDNESVVAQIGMGQLQMELGNMKSAEALFRKSMELKPDEIAPYVFISQAQKIKKNDPILERLESEAETIEELPETKAMSLHFALGKAYDDVGKYDDAFPHFSKGCEIKRRKFNYNADTQEELCNSIKKYFTPETLERLKGGARPSERPIFVLGMPRSGTTLVETILASHPDVFGAGELYDLLRIANQPKLGVKSEGFPISMQGLTAEDIRKMGERYLSNLEKYDREAKRVTDKMPANFLALGLIHLMLPEAKVVHVMRNSADICLSNFTKNFYKSQAHSYDLVDMGRYYVNYAKLMEHWREVLPEGAFYEIQYEQLVADPEPQTRALIDYCGLEWEDACLTPHKTERGIKTASVTQVRQPVYTSSVERWRRYEKHLQPLLEALGEYAPVTK